MPITNEKDLGEALKNEQDTIEIEGDLANKTFKIKATGKVAWGVCVGAIAIAVTAVALSPATGGTSGVAGIAALAPAVATLGASVATTAVMVAVAGGGVGVLNSLRKYEVVSHDKNRLVLKRK